MCLTLKTGAVSVQFREFNVERKSLEILAEKHYMNINLSPHHKCLFKSLLEKQKTTKKHSKAEFDAAAWRRACEP